MAATKPRTNFIYAGIIVLLVICGLWLLKKLAASNGHKDMQRLSSIDFPEDTRTIQEVDNGEFVIIGKYVMDTGHINDFITDYHLAVPGTTAQVNPLMTHYLDSLNRPSLESLSNYHFLADCKGQNSWFVLLNHRSGELWMQVEYPDAAGDAPPCSK